MIYRPVKSFFIIGTIPFALGFFLGLRWIFLFFIEEGTRTHLPSLILAAVLLMMGFQTFLFGLLAELVATNRKLLEDNRTKLRHLELDSRDDQTEQLFAVYSEQAGLAGQPWNGQRRNLKSKQFSELHQVLYHRGITREHFM